MSHIRFSWDERKAKANLAKHGVSFEEATTAFLDDNAQVIDDPDHSWAEQRLLLLGLSLVGRCLLVVHVEHENRDTVRIISARPATRHEEATYWSKQ